MTPAYSISALSGHLRLQFWGKNSKDFNAWLLFKLMPCSQVLGHTLSRFRPTLVPTGPSLGTHGALLGPSWPSSGPPEVILRPPWVFFDVSWGTQVLCFGCHVVTQPDLVSSGSHFVIFKTSSASYEEASVSILQVPSCILDQFWSKSDQFLTKNPPKSMTAERLHQFD